MLEWLKKIVGDSYTDEMDKEAREKIGELFVARDDHNEKLKELKTAKEQLSERDGQLEELKKSAGSNEELQKQIEKLQADNKLKDEQHAKEINDLKIDSAVSAAIQAARGKNAKAIKALLDMEKITITDDGTVQGIDEQIKALGTADDSKFLFDDGKPKLKGLEPTEGADGIPGAEKDKMSYSELVAFLKENPEAKIN